MKVTDVRRCLDCRAVIATIEDVARGVARGCDCPPTCSHPHLPAVADLFEMTDARSGVSGDK